jgi:predicted DNA-binding transcriptional regulator AlpA
VALVARALAGMPAQTGGATPLGAAYIHTRHDWHRAPAEHHLGELLAYLERNQGALVHYAARRRNGEPISTAFMESAVNEIIAKRMNKRQTSCSFPARENLRKEVRPGLCPGPAKGRALGTRNRRPGIKVAEVCRKHGISEPTFYAWKAT